MRTTAIVPLKALDRAKERLADGLDAQSRKRLVAWMFGRVVRACRDSHAVGDVVVVVGDEAAARLARRTPEASVIMELRPGLGAALAAADARTSGAEATLVVAADLPLATGPDLDRVCDAAASARAVVVVPTVDGGTGALLRRPGGVIPTAYGRDSAQRHLDLARRAGVMALRLDVPNLASDIDTPSQLQALRLAREGDRLGVELGRLS